MNAVSTAFRYSFVFALPDAIIFTPLFALLDSCAVIALLHVVSKGVQQGTDKIRTFAAMLQAFLLAAGFHRAAVRPEGLVHLYAPLAAHRFTKAAIAAQQPAS